MVMVNELLCDPEEVAAIANTHFGGGFTAESEQVLSSCAKAAARFRGAIRHYLTVEQDVEFWLDGTGTCFLRLPVLHPVGVSVEVLGEPVTVVGVSRSGLIQFAEPLPRVLGSVQVLVQSCGVAEVPPEVASAVTTAAVIGMTQQPGISQITVGSVSQTFGSTSANGVNEEWSTAVEKWRIQAGDRA